MRRDSKILPALALSGLLAQLCCGCADDAGEGGGESQADEGDESEGEGGEGESAGSESAPGEGDAAQTEAGEGAVGEEMTAEAESSADQGAEAPAEGLLAHFEDAGFRVQEGVVTSFTVADCELLDDCYGNNPSTPYLLFSVPAHPDQPVALGPGSVGGAPKIPANMSSSYLLAANEVVVIHGQTPPAARYFGFTPYLFSRVDGEGERISVFASLGDTLNLVNAGTGPGGPFSAEIAVIAGSDADAVAAARGALEAEGVPGEAINELVFPQALVDFGLDEQSADATMLLGRVALYEDAAAGAAYTEAPPLAVYRLTPEGSGAALAAPARTPRGMGSKRPRCCRPSTPSTRRSSTALARQTFKASASRARPSSRSPSIRSAASTSSPSAWETTATRPTRPDHFRYFRVRAA
ncbi:hypothetical protein G6O69_19695 [Pseudenhygromyxa sp. WMMC2535]|uniref:hypothetical protein n=1 Tax=Pseudenhygromyxa sp. WMMC2535 TaxID=2712867 RepID=UPI001552E8FF|nr:hypothetical protein [Pseudenhygromyxa sp. WMMC2535]NVB40079.1 hypothetical protein [Pseudenhygromyxa sp. WMMC2535]